MQLDILTQGHEAAVNCPSDHHLQDIWCKKCREYYHQCQFIANQSGLQVIGGLYCQSIVLFCQKDKHLFSISYNRKLSHNSLSCQQCKLSEKERQRQKALEEERLKDELLADAQQKLFDSVPELPP
jgi:hypothetical protein